MGQPAQKKPKTERTLLFDPWYLTEGNPDKLCDEAAYEELSFETKVACETAAKDNKALSQGSQPSNLDRMISATESDLSAN